MSYWWVNHKQTFKAELTEGYIWSPFTNNNGGRNQSYDNLPLTQINDVIFSYAAGQIRAVGIVTHRAIPNARPASFGNVGNQWSAEGWLVQVNWVALENRLSPKNYLSVLAPLLPDKYSPIRETGDGNQGIYLAALSELLGAQLLNLIESENGGISAQVQNLLEEQKEDEIIRDLNEAVLPPTTRTAIIQARNGQGLFRREVEQVESCCRLTGLATKPFLVASHIKPWRYSTDKEKLDGHNGFLLSPHVDKLFDKGYIAFSNSGNVLVAHNYVRTALVNWRLNVDVNVGGFSSQQKIYLDYHRDEIFAKKQGLLVAAFG
jgi:hypothetical protein